MSSVNTRWSQPSGPGAIHLDGGSIGNILGNVVIEDGCKNSLDKIRITCIHIIGWSLDQHSYHIV